MLTTRRSAIAALAVACAMFTSSNVAQAAPNPGNLLKGVKISVSIVNFSLSSVTVKVTATAKGNLAALVAKAKEEVAKLAAQYPGVKVEIISEKYTTNSNGTQTVTLLVKVSGFKIAF